MFPQCFHLDGIVHNLLPILGLSFLDRDQRILQNLPLNVNLVACFTCENTARGAVILDVVDLPHRSIGIEVLANLLSQEIFISVDLTHRIVHPVGSFVFCHPGTAMIILKEAT